jgi:hypothetical protein
MIKCYIRNRNGNPVGVVIAEKIIGNPSIGWSLCCKRDKFSKEMGECIALNRAEKYASLPPEEVLPKVPRTVQPYYNYMVNRANKYFKKDYNPPPPQQ